MECDVQRREKDDKNRLTNVKSLFFQLNEKFEQLLKFKGLTSVQLWQTEMDTAGAREMLKTFKVSEYCESFEEQVKQLEHQLELKEYYDIKRPQAIIFSQMMP